MRLNRRLLNLVAGAGFALVAVVALSAAQDRAAGLVVHEWGTFTSVAGPDGQAVPWRPLSGPSDLPCFVNVLKDGPKTWVPGGLPAVSTRIRMETPVIYFYAPRGAEQTVDVRVSFNQGLLTEWYPAATVAPQFIPKEIAVHTSTLEWNGVKVTPDAAPAYPTEKASSHYYAARGTDASPITANGQQEKFLFYRGLADFPVPLVVTANAEGGIAWSPRRSAPAPEHLILFTNRGGRIGYRRVDAPIWKTAIAAPELTASFDTLRAELEGLLVGAGLFPREARAMVDTWRDSWFEEGTRLLYLVPQSSVDAWLPLDVRPAPARVARVFVGRVEVATPAVLNDIEQALGAGNIRALVPYSRFIEPFSAQVLARTPGLEPARVQNMLRLVAASHVSEMPCR